MIFFFIIKIAKSLQHNGNIEYMLVFLQAQHIYTHI